MVVHVPDTCSLGAHSSGVPSVRSTDSSALQHYSFCFPASSSQLSGTQGYFTPPGLQVYGSISLEHSFLKSVSRNHFMHRQLYWD
ncbi:rCG56835 [Rattus norvegicus]|uniref:RCG56835 n=1 Tax=Rattus norvegicus TaxID=10116 RepID=A6KS27_RAT|nr:rCG56835 [Rattus norvegicus]